MEVILNPAAYSPLIIDSRKLLKISKAETSVGKIGGPVETKTKIWDVVKKVLPQVIVALALGFGSMAFFATAISVELLTQVIFCAGVVVAQICRDPPTYIDVRYGNSIKSIVSSISKFSIVNTIGCGGFNCYIHEYGHAFAARTLFNEANPTVWVKPFSGGATSYTVSNNMTTIGRFFGRSGSVLVIAAAGITASVMWAMSQIAIAHKIKKTRPHLSELMNMQAISQVFNDMIYGLTTFWASEQDLGHDFMRLWRVGGIHPFVPIITMVALPMIELGVIYMVSNKGV